MTYDKNNMKIVLVSSLPVQITSPQGCSWSVDNRLALVTQKGVYVYQLVPDPSNKQPRLNFLKTFIENDIDVNPWQLEFVVPDDLLSQLPRELRNEVTLDRILAPHMVGGEQLFRQVRLVGWSPRVLVHGEWRSLLMTVTVDHRVRLLKQMGRKWITEVDLSCELKNYIEQVDVGVEGKSQQETVVENLKAKAYFMATNAFAWKDVGDDEVDHQTLVTGHMNGMIVRWKISSNGESVEARVEGDCNGGLGSVSALSWMEVDGVELALVGGLDGRVSAVMCGEEMEMLGMVWRDPDRLAVSRIEVMEGGKIVLAKGNFLLRLTVSVVKGELVVGDLPDSANVGMSKVAGIVKEGSDLVAVTQKGDVKVWTGKKLTKLEMEIDRKDYWCYGLAASRNNSIYVSLECVSAFSDHLIMRERGRVVFWVDKSRLEIRNCLQHLKKQDCSDLREAWRVLTLLTKVNTSDLEGGEGVRGMRVRWWETAVLFTITGTQEYKDAREQCEIRLRLETAKSILRGGEERQLKEVAARFMRKFGVDFEEDAMEAGEDDWRCKICGGESEAHESVRTVRCKGGHVWPRCVATLMPCDTPILLRCGWCKSNALPQAKTMCDLCEGPLAQI